MAPTLSGPKRVDHVVELCAVARRTPRGGPFDDRRADDRPGVEQTVHIVNGQGGDAVAAARSGRDQTFVIQANQRAADRAQAQAQLIGKLALGDALSRRQSAGDDGRLDPRVCLVCQRPFAVAGVYGHAEEGTEARSSAQLPQPRRTRVSIRRRSEPDRCEPSPPRSG
jgi:hypothetical protein